MIILLLFLFTPCTCAFVDIKKYYNTSSTDCHVWSNWVTSKLPDMETCLWKPRGEHRQLCHLAQFTMHHGCCHVLALKVWMGISKCYSTVLGQYVPVYTYTGLFWATCTHRAGVWFERGTFCTGAFRPFDSGTAAIVQDSVACWQKMIFKLA